MNTFVQQPRQKYVERQGYGPCIFCNHRGGQNGHKWSRCPDVIDPRARYAIFLQNKLCLACGSSKHFARHCISNRVCNERLEVNQCQGKHHQSLHLYFENRYGNARDQWNQRYSPFEANRAADLRYPQLEANREAGPRQNTFERGAQGTRGTEPPGNQGQPQPQSTENGGAGRGRY